MVRIWNLVEFGLVFLGLIEVHEFLHWLAGKIVGINGKIESDYVKFPLQELEKLSKIRKSIIAFAPATLWIFFGFAFYHGVTKMVLFPIAYVATPSAGDIEFVFNINSPKISNWYELMRMFIVVFVVFSLI